MKRIILSLAVIVFVGALVVGATGAFFSDEETSSGNVFAAGAIDLMIDNESYVTNEEGEIVVSSSTSWELSDLDDHLFFNFSDVKPGDIGEDTISLHVNNNDAYACMRVDLTAMDDNELTEPEEDDGDTTGGDGEGELQDFINFVWWVDDGDNVLEDNEDESAFFTDTLADMDGMAVAISDTSDDSLFDEPLEGGETEYIAKAWCFGELSLDPVPAGQGVNPTVATGVLCDGAEADNTSQTDSVELDLSFYAVQSRNNGEFLCSEADFGGEPGDDDDDDDEEVGASLASYAIPTSCDITVGSGQGETATTSATINGGIALAGDGDTICVEDGTYAETVDVDVAGVTLASLTGPLATATIDGGVIIDAANVTVTGFVVMPGDTEGSLAGFYLKEPADNAEISYNEIDASGDANSRGIVNVIGTSLPGVHIHNNYIHGPATSGTGIYTNPHSGTWTIEFNDIDNFAAGIGQWNGANITNNEFEHTTSGSEAIGVDDEWDANGGVAHFNNFLDDTRLNTYTTIAGTINAENNFWDPNGAAAQIDDSNGTVDADPEALSAFIHQ